MKVVYVVGCTRKHSWDMRKQETQFKISKQIPIGKLVNQDMEGGRKLECVDSDHCWRDVPQCQLVTLCNTNTLSCQGPKH